MTANLFITFLNVCVFLYVIQEIKDCLLGRLFAYGALARSGRLIQESEYIKEFTGAVITLATKKRYLQEPAVIVILQLVEKVLNN